MTIQHQILILHYLTMLQDKSNPGQLEPATDIFAYLLSRDELLSIARHLSDKRKQQTSFASLSNAELLNWIGDQYHILSYLTDGLKESIKL